MGHAYCYNLVNHVETHRKKIYFLKESIHGSI